MASKGDFILDNSPSKRSLGYVLMVDYTTNMMLVKFPKIGRRAWIPHKNNGHYTVVQSNYSKFYSGDHQMAAFLSSFILFLGLLLSMSGFSMDIFIDWVNYPQADQSIVFTATKDMNVINVPYTCVVDFDLPDPFTECDQDKRWLKISSLKQAMY